ncbi:MAG: alanine racemase [Deltaproteobacteria bacterium]|nr:alanine racemase [Deltaproteobacteria bacterium]
MYSESPYRKLSWVEVDAAALRHNVGEFRRLIGSNRKLLAVVKSNAYGHGLCETARSALAAAADPSSAGLRRADWLGVFDLDEAARLRDAGIDVPVLIMGDVSDKGLPEAIERGFRLTVPSCDMARRVAAAATRTGRRAVTHIKIETGTNRQGMASVDAIEAGRVLRASGAVEVEGAYTHFANIEDTTDHSYAFGQLGTFNEAIGALERAGIRPSLRHASCSAATILFPETYFEMVRMGIGMYGLWPSRETRVSAAQEGRTPIDLRPALTWKTRVIQVKDVAAGSFVGYGCTFRATRKMKIAVLPVGYANGYDRGFSNTAYVLIRGRRAAVTGRVCMNLIMVDVTDIPDAAAGDEVVLLGRQGDDAITADQLAAMIGTINYEIVARIDPAAPRVLIG